MAPFAFIENNRYTEAPTAVKQWIRKGPAAPGFEAVDVLPTLTRKAVEYIARNAAAKKPFFLYLPLTSPHTPIVPTKEWQGKSGIGNFGDFVMQTDWALGQVMDALETAGIAENTLLIFTSDNGCSPAADVKGLEKKGHFPSGEFRGYKADIWEGGHHIPFIARWPGVTKPGSSCGRLVCLTDLMATCAEILAVKLPDDAGEDSFSILPLLLGKDQSSRESIVHHSIKGMFALREAKHKMIFCAGSGGWSENGADHSPQQLYDMKADIGEQHNLQGAEQAEVARMAAKMEKIIAEGRSTPGAPQKNDVEVKLHKGK